MKLKYMILIVFLYLLLTGIFSAYITGGGYKALCLWFVFVLFWNMISKHLPPINDLDGKD